MTKYTNVGVFNSRIQHNYIKHWFSDSNKNNKWLNKFNDKLDDITKKPFVAYIKDVDKIFAEGFDERDFNENAWYYDKDKVRDWKFKNIPYRRDLELYEQDFAALFLAYWKLLNNYTIFRFLVACAYIWGLVGITILALLFIG